MAAPDFDSLEARPVVDLSTAAAGAPPSLPHTPLTSLTPPTVHTARGSTAGSTGPAHAAAIVSSEPSFGTAGQGLGGSQGRAALRPNQIRQLFSPPPASQSPLRSPGAAAEVQTSGGANTSGGGGGGGNLVPGDDGDDSTNAAEGGMEEDKYGEDTYYDDDGDDDGEDVSEGSRRAEAGQGSPIQHQGPPSPDQSAAVGGGGGCRVGVSRLALLLLCACVCLLCVCCVSTLCVHGRVCSVVCGCLGAHHCCVLPVSLWDACVSGSPSVFVFA